jgi:hypothetical protein
MNAALQPVAHEIDGLQLVHVLNTTRRRRHRHLPRHPVPDPPAAFADDTNANFGAAWTTTVDHEAGQLGLYRLLDKNDLRRCRSRWRQTSHWAAGAVHRRDRGPVTGFSEWIDDSVTGGRLIGCRGQEVKI